METPLMTADTEPLVSTLNRGQLAVIPTDTLYGIVARADNEAAVRRVHAIKKRSAGKPLIVLLASAEQAYDNVALIAAHSQAGRPTSVIVPSPSAPKWLQHPDGSVAYRVVHLPWLQDILRRTGPLVAPSANIESMQPAKDIQQARAYFGDVVAQYVDGGTIENEQASKIVAVSTSGDVRVIRP